MTEGPSENLPPNWTLDGFRLGAWTILPLMPGLCELKALTFATTADAPAQTIINANRELGWNSTASFRQSKRRIGCGVPRKGLATIRHVDCECSRLRA
jgi:hypothetical protein